jgi:tellurite resistance protein TerC
MTTGNILPWVLFNLFVLAMLALDLGVFHRKAREIEIREALLWSLFWIALALVFNAGLLGSGRTEVRPGRRLWSS